MEHDHGVVYFNQIKPSVWDSPYFLWAIVLTCLAAIVFVVYKLPDFVPEYVYASI